VFIKRLHVRNFKSIQEADILFTPLCMIVGANAAGKSNIIDIFRFIGNIINDGIDHAIALQGGMPYLANANMPKGTSVDIHFVLDLSSEGWARSVRNSGIDLHVQELEYRFSLKPHLRGSGYRISEDYLRLTFSYASTEDEDEKKEPTIKDIQYSMCFHKRNEKSSIQRSQNITGNDLDEKIEKALREDIFSIVFSDLANHAKQELMLSRISVLLPSCFSGASFIRIFDFDPKELKKASSMVSTRVLAENGSNIASVLQSILRNKDKRQRLQTLLRRFLPFIEHVSIENNLDKSFAYKIKESYSNRAFHANYLSDGKQENEYA